MEVGSWWLFLAFVTAMVDVTKAPLFVVAIFVLRRVPKLPGAWWVSRMSDSRRALQVAVGLRALGAAIGLLGVVVGQVWMLVPGLLVSYVGAGMFAPARNAVAHGLVQTGALGRVEGLSAATRQLVGVGGIALAGLSLSTLPLACTLATALVVYGISALSTAWVPRTRHIVPSRRALPTEAWMKIAVASTGSMLAVFPAWLTWTGESITPALMVASYGGSAMLAAGFAVVRPRRPAHLRLGVVLGLLTQGLALGMLVMTTDLTLGVVASGVQLAGSTIATLSASVLLHHAVAPSERASTFSREAVASVLASIVVGLPPLIAVQAGWLSVGTWLLVCAALSAGTGGIVASLTRREHSTSRASHPG